MKKLAVMALALASALTLAGCGKVIGSKPYETLDAAEITSANVRLTPPDVELRVEDLDALAELLQNVVIYEKDDSYTEYSGQGVTFTLIMADGSQTSIMAYNPFLVIDGVGYRTKYEPCEALNSYANKLLNLQETAVVLEKPPALSVISDATAVEALRMGYSWQVMNADGTCDAIIADSVHPLDCRELMAALETTERTATLHFVVQPDAISSVRCWSDAHWGDLSAKSETVDFAGDTIVLKAGGYIYEIVARWDTESGSGGTAYYCVYIVTDQ